MSTSEINDEICGKNESSPSSANEESAKGNVQKNEEEEKTLNSKAKRKRSTEDDEVKLHIRKDFKETLQVSFVVIISNNLSPKNL